MVDAIMSSTFMRQSLIEEEEEHGSDDSGVDSGSDTDDVPILAPRRVVRNPNALTLDAGKPYLQQAQPSKQETQRKMETLLNRAAHTPEFQPGAYNAAKLSEDAVRLLADFIQRPSVRKQLTPLVGEIRGKKRKCNPRPADDEPQRKAFIIKETGRRSHTKLTVQQTRVLHEKFEEKKHWNPKECAAMLPSLNQLGPDLAVKQVSRWFDNRRRTLRVRGGSAAAGCGRAGSGNELEDGKKSGADKDKKATRRVRQGEREILEAAFSRNAAPDIRVRHALATTTGLSVEQVTAWFMRRQGTKRAPYGVIPGANDRMVLPGISPNHLATMNAFGASHAFMQGGLLQVDYINAHVPPPLGQPFMSGIPQSTGFGLPNVEADALQGR